MCPRRLLINRSPRYLLMWQCRRLPTVSTSHLLMLPYRRPYKVLRLSTSLHRLVLAQLPRFLLILLSRLPNAVWCYTMLPYNYRSRSSLLAVFSRTILWTAKTLFVSPRHQYKVHVPCCSHRQDSNSSPCLLVPLLALTCTHHMAHLLSAISVTPHSLLSVPPKWEHILSSQLRPAREVLVPPLREPTILLVRILVQEQVPLVLPMVKFGQSKSDGLGHIDTADSDLMHHQFRLSLLQWNPGPAAEILPTLSPLPVESFMRLFFRKPVIMFCTSPISSWRALATRTSLSCSTRTPLSLNP